MELFLEYFTHFHYFGMFFTLILCGLGVPLPEDIVLVTGGYLAYQGHTKIVPTIIVVYTGAILGDILLFSIGRKFGPNVLGYKRFAWLFTPERLKKINHYFDTYGNLTLFFGRFLAGLRGGIYLSAGAFGSSYKKMILMDALAGLITIPAITYSAYYFGSEIDQLLHWIKNVKIAFASVLAIGIVFLIWKKFKRAKA